MKSEHCSRITDDPTEIAPAVLPTLARFVSADLASLAELTKLDEPKLEPKVRPFSMSSSGLITGRRGTSPGRFITVGPLMSTSQFFSETSSSCS